MDPDDCMSTLQERSMTLFKVCFLNLHHCLASILYIVFVTHRRKHTAPDVEFAKDPKRPLYKGVFAMADYREGEYYNPKLEHLSAIYAADRPKKNKPANNLIPQRTGEGEPFPYWVDDWQHSKNNDYRHKQNAKLRKAMEKEEKNEGDGGGGEDEEVPAVAKKRGRAPMAAEEDPNTPTIVPTDGHFILPIGGWMKTATTAKGASLQAVSHSTLLRASPATAMGKSVKNYFAQMGTGAAPPVVAEEPVAVVAPSEIKRVRFEQPSAPIVEQPKATAVVPSPPPPPPVPKPHVNGTAAPPQQSLTLMLRQAKTKFVGEKADEQPLFKAYLAGTIEHDPADLLSEFIRYAVSMNGQ
jgi:hypothetical protein